MANNIVLTPDMIENIRQQTGQEWRECYGKQHTEYVCRIPQGYVFADMYDYPASFNLLVHTYGSPIVPSGLVYYTDIAKQLTGYGAETTHKEGYIVCGVSGELHFHTAEELKALGYEFENDKIGVWVEATVTPPDERKVGIIIPKDYECLVPYAGSQLKTINSKNRTNHGVGDILMADVLPNGQPNLSKVTPVNNTTFALTYNQTRGGWSHTGYISHASDKDIISLTSIRMKYRIDIGKDFMDRFVSEMLLQFKAEGIKPNSYEVTDTNATFNGGKYFGTATAVAAARAIKAHPKPLLNDIRMYTGSNLSDSELVAKYMNWSGYINALYLFNQDKCVGQMNYYYVPFERDGVVHVLVYKISCCALGGAKPLINCTLMCTTASYMQKKNYHLELRAEKALLRKYCYALKWQTV